MPLHFLFFCDSSGQLEGGWHLSEKEGVGQGGVRSPYQLQWAGLATDTFVMCVPGLLDMSSEAFLTSTDRLRAH